MSPKNVLIYGVVLIIVVLGVLFSAGVLSVIGEFKGVTSCEINSSYGGSCDMELVLPNYREVVSYDMDLSFDSLPGEYLERTKLNSFASASGVTEGDKDEPTNEEDLDTHYVYFYRIPASWEDVYSLKLEAESSGSISKSNDRADGSIDVSAGYISVPYTSSSISKCTSESSCKGTNYLIEYYDDESSSRPDEKRFRINWDERVPIRLLSEDLYADNSYEQYSGALIYSGFIPVGVLNSVEIVDLEKELVLFSHIEVEEEWKGYVDWSVVTPPVLYVSYAKEYKPSNLQIKVGDIILQSIVGESVDMTTIDMAVAINDYCDRTSFDKSVDECSVPITFVSSSGGIINAVAEDATLIALGEDGNPVGNLLTGGVTFGEDAIDFFGNSFDFSGSPVQAWVTSGVLFLLVIGIIMFVPFKKK